MSASMQIVLHLGSSLNSLLIKLFLWLYTSLFL